MRRTVALILLSLLARCPTPRDDDHATLGAPPSEEGLPPGELRFEDLDGCYAEGSVGLLWEHRDASGRSAPRPRSTPSGSPSSAYPLTACTSPA